MIRSRAVVTGVVAAGLLCVPSVAWADGGGHGSDHAITTLATGLDGPRQVSEYTGNQLVVAESDSGVVAAVNPRNGKVTTLLKGLFAPQGVAYDDGLLFVALGGPPPPDEPGAVQPAPGQTTSALVVAKPNGKIVKTIDLKAYELAHNPDKQLQFLPDGSAPDSLSNPYSVFVQDRRILVADAGGNDVLAIDRHTWAVSTLFVPPVVTPAEDPACNQPENDPGKVGCDPVPTGIAQGPDGLLYVSTLGGLAPGAARVYVIDQRGHVVRVIKGLDNATGVAVDGHGTVYVTDLLQGAPQGPPAPGFDPATVGQVVRIDRHGHRSYSQVTMPNGLLFEDGQLYASAWSIAAELGKQHAGQVVRIGSDTFGPPAK